MKRKTIDIDKIRMRSLAGFYVLNIWCIVGYVAILADGLHLDYSRWNSNDERSYYLSFYGDNALWMLLAPIFLTVSFPLMYFIFYYPQLWYAQMRADVREVEVIKEVEVLREIEVIKEVPVFREQQQPSVVIRNVNVKDGVMMNDVMD